MEIVFKVKSVTFWSSTKTKKKKGSLFKNSSALNYFFFLTWEDWLGKGVQGHKFHFYELKN